MKRFENNEPLLYVDQPKLMQAKSKMQITFTSQSEQATTPEQKAVEKEQTAEKSFAHLSIEEKIDYLTTFPSDLLQMRCKFKVKDKTYFGRITNSDDETIEITHSGRQKVRVNKEALEHIQLMGL